MAAETTPVATLTGQYREKHRNGRTRPIITIAGLTGQVYHGS